MVMFCIDGQAHVAVSIRCWILCMDETVSEACWIGRLEWKRGSRRMEEQESNKSTEKCRLIYC